MADKRFNLLAIILFAIVLAFALLENSFPRLKWKYRGSDTYDITVDRDGMIGGTTVTSVRNGHIVSASLDGQSLSNEQEKELWGVMIEDLFDEASGCHVYSHPIQCSVFYDPFYGFPMDMRTTCDGRVTDCETSMRVTQLVLYVSAESQK